MPSPKPKEITEAEAEKELPIEGNPFKLMMKNPIAFSCISANSFRYFTMHTFDFFYPAFMLMAYPTRKVQFATLNALCTFGCGLFAPSSAASYA